MPRFPRGSKVRNLQADRVNAAFEAGVAHERQRAQAKFRDQSIALPGNSWILIQNKTGADQSQFSAFEVGLLAADFSYANANLSFWRNCVQADFPSATSRVIAISQQAAAIDAVVPACVVGLTFARVNTGGSGQRVKVSAGSSELVRTESGGIGEIIGDPTAISLIKIDGGLTTAKRVYGTIASAASVCAASCTVDGVVGIDNPHLGDDPLTVQNPIGYPLCVGGYVVCELEWNGDYIITSIVPATAVVDVYTDAEGLKIKTFGCNDATACGTEATVDTWGECP